MDFPMRIPFELGKVKNSNEWDETTELKFLELVNLINNFGSNKLTNQILTPLNTTVTLTSEFNITEVESILNPETISIELDIDTDLQKRLYYLIVDSNKAEFNFTSNTVDLLSNSHGSFNRTLYVLRKLDETTVIIYRELKDIYLPDDADFDTEDFIDWDLTVG